MATTREANWKDPKSGRLICPLCGVRRVHFVHDAAPISEGKCCNRCYTEHVVPASAAISRNPGNVENWLYTPGRSKKKQRS
jgi:hypothetical protein